MPKTRRQANTILESVLNAQVPIITEWQTYTPVVTNSGATYTASAQYRRVGGSIEVKGTAIFNSAGSGSGIVGFSFPSGLTAAISGGDVAGIGFTFGGGGAGFVTLNVRASGAGVYFSRQGANNNWLGSEVLNGLAMAFECTFPISGWSSTQTLRQQLGL